jgi:hypothetical protein
MPGTIAALGDVYWVYRTVTENPTAFGAKKSRPCGCVAPRPYDPTTWTALPRLTHDIRPNDLTSPAMPEIELKEVGAWSLRWVHQVHKSKTGGDACKFLGALPQTERDRLVGFYRSRHSDARGVAGKSRVEFLPEGGDL